MSEPRSSKSKSSDEIKAKKEDINRQFELIKDKYDSKWVINGITKRDVTDFAEEFAEFLCEDECIQETLNDGRKNKTYVSVALTTSQLRKFFGAVKSIQLNGIINSPADFLMLKPKLAYAVGRLKQQGGNKDKILKIEYFSKIISKAIDDVGVGGGAEEKILEQRFKNFVNFFEAIVAYQKVYNKDK